MFFSVEVNHTLGKVFEQSDRKVDNHDVSWGTVTILQPLKHSTACWRCERIQSVGQMLEDVGHTWCEDTLGHMEHAGLRSRERYSKKAWNPQISINAEPKLIMAERLALKTSDVYPRPISIL